MWGQCGSPCSGVLADVTGRVEGMACMLGVYAMCHMHAPFQPGLTRALGIQLAYNLRPRLPPFLLVESVGTGVVSSMRPIFMPARASALRAD